ncbi:HlyC/CorC family transporter [Uliginosibacterium sediminicola]|uniref:CNNM domain-containing protein n=1 Tax=Uliginosibacterium sediminicola TaxID=2024550 RepID=A0ABU9YZT8_9RHOO
MDDIPLSAQLLLLAILLISSGFFSLAETAMMAANRYRLKSAAAQGSRGAQLALQLLANTERLLGVVLLFNNLINAASATLVSLITIRLFGEDKWALGLGTLAVTFLILVFAEITPKVIGANHADKLSALAAYVLTPLLRASYFVVGFINLFVTAILRLLRVKAINEETAQSLSPEELRMMVLESSHYIPPKHRSILLNLFELEEVTVEDVMVPRGAMEALDLASSEEQLRQQIATSYHSRLPVFFEEPNNVLGILHQRRLLPRLLEQDFNHETLRELLAPAYFIPANTPVYSQLQFFQENHQRLGLVVDEYGEMLGLVTLEDIIEELIGKFTTSVPGTDRRLKWDDNGSVTVDGSRSLRELNRLLGLNLPLEGPKTLNGLVLEQLEDIPESGVSVKIGNVPIEVLQREDRRIKTARIFRPQDKTT